MMTDPLYPLDDDQIVAASRIDEICDRFERQLVSGESPRIEDFLGDTEEPVRTRLLGELVGIYRAHERSSDGPDAVEDPPSPPKSIGKYQIQDVLGKGGFGTVYLGYDEDIRSYFAIKVPSRPMSGKEVTRYLREARRLDCLDHPGVVRFRHCDRTASGLPYLVCQLIEGCDLETKIKYDRPSPKAAAKLVAQIATILQYIHDQNIIHRDLKPGNIIINQQGDPVLIDFGLAQGGADSLSDSFSNRFAGTLSYASPEQASGENDRVDTRSDLYSLGIVLYELLTGRRPFRGPDLLQQILKQRPPAMRQLPGGSAIPRALETICRKAVAKDPQDRYQSGREMAEDLQRFEVNRPIRARRSTPLRHARKWIQTHPVTALLATSLLGLAVWGGVQGAHLYHNQQATSAVEQWMTREIDKIPSLAPRLTRYRERIRVHLEQRLGQPVVEPQDHVRLQLGLLTVGFPRPDDLLEGLLSIDERSFNRNVRTLARLLQESTHPKNLVRSTLVQHWAKELESTPRRSQSATSTALSQNEPLESTVRLARICQLLIALDAVQLVLPLLEDAEDLTLRTAVMLRTGNTQGNADGLFSEYSPTAAAAVRQATVLSIHIESVAALPESQQRQLIDQLKRVYRTDPDSGVHLAAQWALRKLGQHGMIQEIDRELMKEYCHHGVPNDRNWYVDAFGLTMIILNGPQEFWILRQRKPFGLNDSLHKVTLPYRVAISASEISVDHLRKLYPEVHERLPDHLRCPRLPATHVSWVRACEFCNRLSTHHQLPVAEHCYPQSLEMGSQLADDFLQRTGYRLPTYQEWILAARGQSRTPWFYGRDHQHHSRFAWSLHSDAVRQQNKVQPIGQLLPNQTGFFDILGNAWEWCHDAIDKPIALTVTPSNRQYLCGGGRAQEPTEQRIDRFSINSPIHESPVTGFRVARTLPPVVIP